MTATTAAPRTRRGRTPAPRGRFGPAWLDGPMTSSHLVLGAAGLLLAIGLVIVFSASSIEAALDKQPPWQPGVMHLIMAAVGLVTLLVALRLPVGFLRRWSPIALLVVTAMLALVWIPGIGVELNGSRQWFSLGFTTFQPSEAAKLVFALWGAHVLALRERYLTTKSLLVPVLPVFLLLALLLILEPDFGGVVTLGLVLVGLLWAGGMPLRWFGGLALAAAALLALLVVVAPYRMERITSFLDPFADQGDSGFQAIQGFYALASGGLSGVGLGNSRMKANLLPEAESDYIFAIIGEELGFLGCLVVITLYGVLAYAGFRIARRSADRFVQLASTAITVWLIGQASLNMGYVVGLLPVTGVTLPLISKGGTSLVLTLFAVGLLARFARAEPAAIEAQRKASPGRLSRWLLPVPAAAVDPVRPRRRPEERGGRGPAMGGGRTVVHARGMPRRPQDAAQGRPPAGERHRGTESRPDDRRLPAGDLRRSPVRADVPRAATPRDGRRAVPPAHDARVQPPSARGAPARTGRPGRSS